MHQHGGVLYIEPFSAMSFIIKHRGSSLACVSYKILAYYNEGKSGGAIFF